MGRGGAAKFDMKGAPARVDDDIGHDIVAGWFHQDVNPAPRAAPAHCVTDDPAHGIPGGDRSWPDQLLAFLQHDVGDLPWRGIDLEERAFGPGIFLDRIEECRALGLDPRGIVGAADALTRIAVFGRDRWESRAERSRAGKHRETI